MSFVILNAGRGKEKFLIDINTIRFIKSKDGATVSYIHTDDNVYTAKHSIEELQEKLNEPDH